MVELIDGKKIASRILNELKIEVSKLHAAGIFPRLVVFLAGGDPASISYTKIKKKRAEEIGLAVDLISFPSSVSKHELAQAIEKANREKGVSGILVQLPLPPSLPAQEILDLVLPDLDVDCLNSENKRRLADGDDFRFYPPAPAAIMEILENYNVGLGGHIVLVGSGQLIGKPLASMLLSRKISFEIANRQTQNFGELVAKADVLISAVGKPGLITGDMVKPGVVVIDAGAAGSEKGEILGDVEVRSVSEKARLLAAVPGGVGPVTVAMVLRNVVKSAQRQTKLPGSESLLGRKAA